VTRKLDRDAQAVARVAFAVCRRYLAVVLKP
jgi:hypothetical protein